MQYCNILTAVRALRLSVNNLPVATGKECSQTRYEQPYCLVLFARISWQQYRPLAWKVATGKAQYTHTNLAAKTDKRYDNLQ